MNSGVREARRDSHGHKVRDLGGGHLRDSDEARTTGSEWHLFFFSSFLAGDGRMSKPDIRNMFCEYSTYYIVGGET